MPDIYDGDIGFNDALEFDFFKLADGLDFRFGVDGADLSFAKSI